MANKKQKLSCSILFFNPDPVRKGNTIITIEFNDGKGDPWRQDFSVSHNDRPYSLDEFKMHLKNMRIERPVDPFQDLKEYRDFELELDEQPIAAPK